MDRQRYNYTRSLSSNIPNLNASAGQSYNYGRTIDPYTNQFANQQVNANSFSLSADWTIFNGLQKLNDMRQAQWARDASYFGIKKAQDDISLSIANQYLQILLLNERRKQLLNQIENSQAQLKRLKTLLDAGATTQSKELEAEAQVATDMSSLVDIENQITQGIISMKQMMSYEPSAPLKIAEVNFQGRLQEYTYADVESAYKNRIPELPAVLQASYLKQSAYFNLRSMKGNYSPKLIFGASLHSVYSSAGKMYSYAYGGFEPIGIVGTDTSKVVYGPRLNTVARNISFSQQLSNNFGQTIGLTLQIPIFNGLQTKYSVQTAQIQLNNAEIDLYEAQRKAKNDIYQAFESMNMSKKKLDASEIRIKSQESLYKMADINLAAGVISFYDYSVVKSNYNNAELDLLQAKYSYIFQTKVFEYYLGKPVQF
jgi:outer membrane protein